MKTLKEMKELVEQKKAQVLTVEAAKTLKGRKIQTIYFGYAGQDHTDEFIVGDVVSELEYYRHLNEDCYPRNGFQNRAEEWESWMSEEVLAMHRDKLVLTREDGSSTDIFCHDAEEGVFTCCDDNYVFYVES